MQKVISLFSFAPMRGTEVQSMEATYPELEKLLNEGFKIKEVLSQISSNTTSTVTLLLEKE